MHQLQIGTEGQDKLSQIDHVEDHFHEDYLLAAISPTGDLGKCEEVQELSGDSDQAGI